MTTTAQDKNKFSMSYLIFGEGPKDWYKALGAFAKVLVVLIILYGLYSAWTYFFPKPTQQSQVIHMGKDSKGTVTIQNISKDKKAFIPFIEGGAEARDKENIGAFIRAGVRIEF
jgi:hypothetical protein